MISLHNFSDFQLNNIKSVFNQLANKDSCITINDTKLLFRSLGQFISEEELNNLITYKEYINYDEYINFYVQNYRHLYDFEPCINVFQFFDQQRTGYISIADLNDIISSGKFPFTSDEKKICEYIISNIEIEVNDMDCQYCGSSDTVYNESRGELICTNCGAILKQSTMVDQLTFTSSGALIGHLLDKSRTVRSFGSIHSRQDYNELALLRGWNNLERLAGRMSMQPAIIEASKRLYHLALQRNFTLGRNNYFVASACLYAVCRKEQAEYMLVDFSDALQTPIKNLAQVYMKLTRALTLKVPAIDPSLYMERYANELNLGEDAHKVALTGVKLVQALTRNWIVTGRRPLGLCGVALLISAAYHKISLDPKHLRFLFRVSNNTFERRLAEFNKTDIASIPIQSFENIDLDKIKCNALPPCMKRKQKNPILLMLSHDSINALKNIDAEEIKVDNEINNYMECNDLLASTQEEEKSLAGTIPLKAIATMSQICDSKLIPNDADKFIENLLNEIQIGVQSLAINKPRNAFNRYLFNFVLEKQRILTELSEIIPAHIRSTIINKYNAKEMQNMAVNEVNYNTKYYQNSSTLYKNINTNYMLPLNGTAEIQTNYDDNQRTSVLSDSIYEELELNLEETLTDVDDNELQSMILNDEDKETKARLWDQLTKDIMPLVQQRYAMRKQIQNNKVNKLTPKRKKTEQFFSDSAANSVKYALQTKSKVLESNLNEHALDALFSGELI